MTFNYTLKGCNVVYRKPNNLKKETLSQVQPWVQYGIKEAENPHAIMEVAAISYLKGKRYDSRMAHQIVESWGVGKCFV